MWILLTSSRLATPYRVWPRGTRPTWWECLPKQDYQVAYIPGVCLHPTGGGHVGRNPRGGSVSQKQDYRVAYIPGECLHPTRGGHVGQDPRGGDRPRGRTTCKSRPPGGCSSELPGEEGHSLSPPPLCWPTWPQTQLAQRSSIQLHWLKKETSLKALNCITFHSVINHLSTTCM